MGEPSKGQCFVGCVRHKQLGTVSTALPSTVLSHRIVLSVGITVKYRNLLLVLQYMHMQGPDTCPWN